MSTTNPDTKTPDTLDRLFAWCRSLGIRRPATDRWGAGVCSGLANRLGVDPILIRAAFVVLACFAGLGITAYLVGWAFLPNERGELLVERAARHGDPWPVVLLAVIAFSVFGGPVLASENSGWAGGWWVLPLALVGWVVLRTRRGESIIPSRTAPNLPTPSAYTAPYAAPPAPDAAAPADTASAAGTPATAATVAADTGGPTQTTTLSEDPMNTLAMSSAAPAVETGSAGSDDRAGAIPPPTYVPPVIQGPPPPPQPRRRRPPHFTGLVTFGLAVAAYGVGVLVDEPLGFDGSAHLLGLILALGVVGVVLLALGLAGRRAGFSAVLAVVLGLSAATAAATPKVNWGDGIGDRTWAPSLSSTNPSYSLGVGSARLDLRHLPTEPTTPARITVGQGIGDLVIEVPQGLTVAVATSVGIGDITLGNDVVSETKDTATGTNDARFDHVVGTGTPDVYVDAHVGIGSITITVIEGASV